MKKLKSMVSVKLNYMEWGDPNASKSALLVHGITLSANSFWRIASRLAADGYLVRAVDLRGHGDSPPTESYLLEELAADVLRFRPDGSDAWDIIIGHSLGGTIATCLLSCDKGFAKSALLIDPALQIPPAAEMEAFVLSEIDAVTHHNPFMLRAESPHLDREDVDRKAMSLSQSSAYAVSSILRDNSPWDLLPLFADISVPVFILGADEANAVVPKALGAAISSKYENVSYFQVPGADHGVHRTHPDAVMEKALEVAALGAE
jgi:pimeloyl-ACP methyl ester carboxylesterase